MYMYVFDANKNCFRKLCYFFLNYREFATVRLSFIPSGFVFKSVKGETFTIPKVFSDKIHIIM